MFGMPDTHMIYTHNTQGLTSQFKHPYRIGIGYFPNVLLRSHWQEYHQPHGGVIKNVNLISSFFCYLHRQEKDAKYVQN